MIADLIIIGIAVKVIVGAVQRGRAQRPAPGSAQAGK
jgi:hypothetical protein